VAGSEPAPIAGLGPFVLGVVRWRDRGIAAVDVRRLRDEGITTTTPERWIVIRIDDAILALTADSVREVQRRSAASTPLDLDALRALFKTTTTPAQDAPSR
jgi:chemotaxis signal transduction protein